MDLVIKREDFRAFCEEFRIEHNPSWDGCKCLIMDDSGEIWTFNQFDYEEVMVELNSPQVKVYNPKNQTIIKRVNLYNQAKNT